MLYRNAENELFILDQIRIRTGLLVKVLSNSEHRFISYKSVAMREDFERMIQKGAAVVDAGGGGMQITVFSKGKVSLQMRKELLKEVCAVICSDINYVVMRWLNF